MNRLDPKRRAQVIAALVEGNSIRATVRMTDVAKNTIQKLLLELGAVCATYMDDHLRGLTCRRIQCDEIWTFIGAKQRNVTDKVRHHTHQPQVAGKPVKQKRPKPNHKTPQPRS